MLRRVIFAFAVFGATTANPTLTAPVVIAAADHPPFSWHRSDPVREGVWGQSIIYDPVRGRFIQFGGRGESVLTFHNTVWTFTPGDPLGWTLLRVEGPAPQTRVGHSAIYDPVRDRMVIFGGGSGYSYSASDDPSTLFNDVWALSLGANPTWSQILPAGQPPRARFDQLAVYDSRRDRLIVFGGSFGYTLQTHYQFLNDCWSLDLADPAWSLIPTGTPSPGPRQSAQGVYDEARDRLVLFGGHAYQRNVIDGFQNDMWQLSLETESWREIAPGEDRPHRRYGHTVVLDKEGERMFMLGGRIVSSPSESAFRGNDCWSFSLTQDRWSLLPPPTPSIHPRERAGGAWDPDRRRLIIAGGLVHRPMASTLSYETETWSLDPDAEAGWSQETLRVAQPGARGGGPLVFDPLRRRFLLISGVSAALGTEVWAFSTVGTDGWARLETLGTSPPDAGTAALYDPRRDRIVIYRGETDLTVWALSLSGLPEWSVLSSSGTAPSTRWSTTMMIDGEQDRLVLFGGAASYRTHADTWGFALEPPHAWTRLDNPNDLPLAARGGHAAVLDPLSHRLLVYGGTFETGGGPHSGYSLPLKDLWGLPMVGGPVWSQLRPTGPSPGTIPGPAIYHPARKEMLLPHLDTNQVWALGLEGALNWQSIPFSGDKPPSVIDHRGLAFDPIENRLGVYQGRIFRFLPLGAPPHQIVEVDDLAAAWEGQPATIRWELRDVEGPLFLVLEREDEAGQRTRVGAPIYTTESTGAIADPDVGVDGAVYQLGVLGAEDEVRPLGRILLPAREAFEQGALVKAPAPNPFSASTILRYQVAGTAPVRASVHDISGRLLRRIDAGVQDAGWHTIEWNGRSDSGREAAAGIYILTLEAGGRRHSQRVTLVR